MGYEDILAAIYKYLQNPHTDHTIGIGMNDANELGGLLVVADVDGMQQLLNTCFCRFHFRRAEFCDSERMAHTVIHEMSLNPIAV